MIRTLNIFALLIVFAVLPIILLDYLADSIYLDKFLKDRSLSLIGTILAIYIAITSSFIAILNRYEYKQRKAIFITTVKELKQNILFLFIVFFIHFLLLVGTPENGGLILTLILKSAKVFTFILFIYALYDISNSIFTLKSKLNIE